MTVLQRSNGFRITPAAAAELNRQAAFAGTPGQMHFDFVEDACEDSWLHIRLSPGKQSGIAVCRADGVTLYSPSSTLDLLSGLILSYYADMSGGGFLISTPPGCESCACGAGFRKVSEVEK